MCCGASIPGDVEREPCNLRPHFATKYGPSCPGWVRQSSWDWTRPMHTEEMDRLCSINAGLTIDSLAVSFRICGVWSHGPLLNI